MTTEFEFKKDYIDNGVINYSFIIRNPIDNEFQQVWMLAPYHGDEELDQAEFNKCKEQLVGASSGD